MLLRRLLLSVVLLSLSTPLWAKKVDLDYRVRFLPETEQAEVSLTLEDGARVISLAFNFLITITAATTTKILSRKK